MKINTNELILILLFVCFFSFTIGYIIGFLEGDKGVYARTMNIESEYTVEGYAMNINFPYEENLVIINDDFVVIDYFYEDDGSMWIKTNITNGTNKFMMFYTK